MPDPDVERMMARVLHAQRKLEQAEATRAKLKLYAQKDAIIGNVSHWRLVMREIEKHRGSEPWVAPWLERMNVRVQRELARLDDINRQLRPRRRR